MAIHTLKVAHAHVSVDRCESQHRSTRLVQLLATVLSHQGLVESSTVLATELAGLMHCTRVSVGFIDKGYAKLVAASYGADVKAKNNRFEAIEAAMDEAIEQATSLIYPAVNDAKPRILLAHAELLGRQSGGISTIPLVSTGGVVGAITLERTDLPFSSEELALCEDIASFTAPVLVLKRDSERPWYESALAALRRGVENLTSAGHIRMKLAVHGGLALIALLCLLPVTYRIGAPARLEGLVQRVIVAPTDGFLQQAHVRPGDAVKAGQVLVDLAEQDLRVERRKWESELAQHENAYGAALARADRTQLVIYQAKAAEARSQLALVEQQLERSRILAPFDGIVIEGDLTQSLGAPVRRGQTLMTLAPRDQYRLIIEVDERDIAEVAVGKTGRLALTASPSGRINFAIERVTPVATTEGERHFFAVEAKPETIGAPFRPGLRGIAKIEAGSHSLAWLATHRFVDWLRLAFWSWGA